MSEFNQTHPNQDELNKLKEAIRSKINEMRNYTPKIGVFGVTGVGKSSLCNALFGSDMAEVSDVAACTRNPQELFISNNNGKGIKLIDVPGVGERIERDVEYFELYKNLMPELDLVIWVIKADDRAYTVAERAYKEILKPHAERCPVVFVINQVDRINPLREWDVEKNQPGEKQQNNILIKIDEISKAFNVSTKFISTVSASERYNLLSLMDLIVEVLPKEKKYAVLREANEDVKNEEMQEKAEKGIWDTVKEMAGNALEAVKDFAVDVVVKSAGNIVRRFFSWF
ncbi:MAG: 50S ribosome-binding GTPase [Neisseria zoodegmatis]|uniref:GTPase family protein n=1 Tax=Neisseria zoodegmatis TaxID=326523 RepID=UPI0026EA3CC3|nr:GTPase [Neisseria zoodegmatis]MDO5070238.1 50S ribosome-binding GTPase [Neisseria zoodegmatis]